MPPFSQSNFFLRLSLKAATADTYFIGTGERKCPNRGVKLFGVRLTDESIRKSASMGNLTQYMNGGTGTPQNGVAHDSMGDIPDQASGSADGYASEDFVVGSSFSRERKKASLAGSGSSPLQVREKLYLLAVGYYRSGDYSRSRQLVERCLEVAPDWRQALRLKKAIEDKIKKDGAIGIGIAATAVGVLAGGIAAAVAAARKK